jgi:hypothetical protein
MIRTQISFDEDLYRAAQAQAKRMGISLAELCRRALATAIAPPPSGPRPWSRFAGIIDEGDIDDSDNDSIDALVHGRDR